MCIYIDILSIAPLDKPRNFNGNTLNSTSIRLSWTRPATPNGVITNYSLVYHITDDDSIPTTLSIDDITTTIDDLNEYTNYTFAISAVTSVGSGPEAMVTAITDEDGMFKFKFKFTKFTCNFYCLPFLSLHIHM